MKKAYKDLNNTVSGYTSKLPNNKTSFATIEAAVDRLDVAVNGRACFIPSDELDKAKKDLQATKTDHQMMKFSGQGGTLW